MKKFYCVLSLFAAIAAFVCDARAQSVDNFDDFNAGLAVSTPSYSITLSSDIAVKGSLNAVTPGFLAVNGAGFCVDGAGWNTGFVSGAGKVLSFSDITIKNFSFSSGQNSLGGAINNAGVLYIHGSTISHNSVSNDSGDSSSKSYGGALYNSGSANIYNSSFLYNSAANISKGISKGGAVFNEGVLNIIADGADVAFTGNTAGGKSNAVHNAANASVNLNAAAADSIMLNDAVTGDNGIINVNRSGDWDSAANPGNPSGNGIPLNAPDKGTAVFNNSVTGNDINLYGGTLKLGVFDGIKDPSDEKKFLVPASRGSIGTKNSRNALTVYDGSVFDMANRKADDVVYVSSFNVVSGTVNVKIDVDLSGRKSDKIDISQATLGTGKLSFYGINIVRGFAVGVSADVKVFADSTTMTANYLDGVDFVAYASTGVYRVTRGSDNLSLNFFLTEYTDDPFQHAVNIQTGDRSYTMKKDYNVPGKYNSLLATGTLHVSGSGEKGAPVSIYGNKVSNIFNVSGPDTELNLENFIIKEGSSAQGGAIRNAGKTAISKTRFEGNVAVSTHVTANGGAIYNENILNIYDSSFYGNTAEGDGAAGGAIYSKGGTVNIAAEKADVEFKGNKAGDKANALHISAGTKLNLNAFDGRVMSFEDSITSDGSGNIINLNASSADDASVLTSARTGGSVYLNSDMSSFGNLNSASGNTVNLYNGSIKFGRKTLFFKNVKFTMRGGARLDMTNGKIDKVSVQDFNLPDAKKSYLSIDADLHNGQADNFTGSKLNDNSGELVIDRIVIIKDLHNLEKKVSIQIADDDKLKRALRLNNAVEEILGPVFTYFARYKNGRLEFEHTFDFNPSVFIAPVTLQTGGYLGQLHSYRQAFGIIDRALTQEGVKGLWVNPYAYNEDIRLNKKLTVSNTAYGAYAGYNSAASNIGKGINGVFSVYGAYNASDQSYKGASIMQGGGLLGVSAVIFKEKFYTALTANVGMINEHGEGKYGKDNFMMYTKGAALKTGCNFALDGDDKFVLQPSLNLSCSVVDVAPYKNTAGVKVNVERFNPFHIEPGLKLAAGLDRDLMSFVNLSGVWSLAGDTNCRAAGIKLPEMSVDPYVRYEAGIEKAFSETFSAGAGVYGVSLGRKGAGGQLSMRWKF